MSTEEMRQRIEALERSMERLKLVEHHIHQMSELFRMREFWTSDFRVSV
jgi:hypothetical protein